MDDVVFCDPDSGEPLPFDEDGGYYWQTQFDKWLVRSTRPLEEGQRIGLWAEKEFHALEWRDDTNPTRQGYVLPTVKDKDSNSQKKGKEKTRGAAEGPSGLLKLFLWSGNKGDRGKPLEPPLFTIPASLSQEQYGALLAQLREIAIANTSAVYAPLPTSDQTVNQRPTASETLSLQAQAVVKLAETVKSHWSLISSQPSRELRRKPTIVSADQPRTLKTPSGVLSQAIRPDRAKVTVATVVDTHDTSENRVLRYVIEQIVLKQAPSLARRLERRSRILRSQQGSTLPSLKGLPENFRGRFSRYYAEQQERLKNRITEYSVFANKLKEAVAWAKNFVQPSWLWQATTQATIPKQPSQRLLRGNDYAPIYQAYLEVARLSNLDTASSVLDLLSHYEERPVRAVDKLYELWVFFQTYQTLVDDFGFHPKGLHPIEALKWERGCLQLPNEAFQLVLVIEDQGRSIEVCQAELHYDAVITAPDCVRGKLCFDSRICTQLPCYQKIQGEKPDWKEKLRPDVWLTIRYDSHTYRFALDAKYRAYAKQSVYEVEQKLYGANNQFDGDVIGTAKMKYFDGLACDAAFVVHTDADPQFTFWGEKPFRRAPHRQDAVEKSGLQIEGRSTKLVARLLVERDGAVWPAHRFGAVYATPLHPENLYKLLKCLLMYHAHIVNICWNCRKRMTAIDGTADVEPTKVASRQQPTPNAKQDLITKIEKGERIGSVYYQCAGSGFGDFWVLQRCSGPDHHPLIKLGPHSFHAPSRIQPDRVWVNLCPACGSDLPPEHARFSDFV